MRHLMHVEQVIYTLCMCIWGGKGVEGRLLSETLDGKE